MGFLKDTYREAKRQFEQLGLGHDDQFNEDIILTTSINEDKYDFVDITGVSPETITKVNDSITGLEALSKKVVLRDFIFRLCDSEGIEVKFLVHCYLKKIMPIMANDGKRYRRFIDLYQLSAEGGEVLNICQIVLLHNKFPLRYHMRRVGRRVGKKIVTRHSGAIERYESLVERGGGSPLLHAVTRLADPGWEKRTEYVLYHYFFMLHEMVNCPERYAESKDGERRIFRGLNEVRKTRNVIHPEHTVGSSATSPKEEQDRVIQCPYWTVKGHPRHLKSGKVIWIEPYAKGKDRNNPDRIVAKTYEIRKE